MISLPVRDNFGSNSPTCSRPSWDDPCQSCAMTSTTPALFDRRWPAVPPTAVRLAPRWQAHRTRGLWCLPQCHWDPLDPRSDHSEPNTENVHQRSPKVLMLGECWRSDLISIDQIFPLRYHVVQPQHLTQKCSTQETFHSIKIKSRMNLQKGEVHVKPRHIRSLPHINIYIYISVSISLYIYIICSWYLCMVAVFFMQPPAAGPGMRRLLTEKSLKICSHDMPVFKCT